MNKDLVIIGGGPAGMAAAISAYESGVRSILVIERSNILGGVLTQCIHNGFGIEYFGENYTGPEYRDLFINKLQEKGIEYLTNTTVTDIKKLDTNISNNIDKEYVINKQSSIDKQEVITKENSIDRQEITTRENGIDVQIVMNNKRVIAWSKDTGKVEVDAKSIIFATGCRERTMGMLDISGERPAGIITAGSAQRYINILGQHIGENIVILGSGDIGLIMARRLTLEGKNVLGVIEQNSYPGGLVRNIISCLDEYNIPLILSHKVTKVLGKSRLTGVEIEAIDEKGNIIPESKKVIECDTLLLSVGLIPENELTKMAGAIVEDGSNKPETDEWFETSEEGIFVCGNAHHVYELVDHVSKASEKAGLKAASYILQKSTDEILVSIQLNNHISDNQCTRNQSNITDESNKINVIGDKFNIANTNEKKVKINTINDGRQEETYTNRELYEIYKNNNTMKICSICPKSCAIYKCKEDNTIKGAKCNRGIKNFTA